MPVPRMLHADTLCVPEAVCLRDIYLARRNPAGLRLHTIITAGCVVVRLALTTSSYTANPFVRSYTLNGM